jgi:hypothetical protein
VYGWTFFVDVPLDLPTGTYRYRVEGRRQGVDGPVAYSVLSREFEVRPSEELVPRIDIDASAVAVRGLWPAPQGTRYATRPTEAATGEAVVVVVRNGAEIARHTVALGVPTEVGLEPGDVVRVASGGLRDGFGNTNATGVEATA